MSEVSVKISRMSVSHVLSYSTSLVNLGVKIFSNLGRPRRLGDPLCFGANIGFLHFHGVHVEREQHVRQMRVPEQEIAHVGPRRLMHVDLAFPLQRTEAPVLVNRLPVKGKVPPLSGHPALLATLERVEPALAMRREVALRHYAQLP